MSDINKRLWMKYLIFCLTICLAGLQGIAQEIVTGLQTNPQVQEKFSRLKQSGLYPPEGDLPRNWQEEPVTLPFLDDFSALNVYPSSRWWVDHDAFENDDYPIFPVNIGAMTLDAINDSGNMYPVAEPGPATFIADHLTSRYIRLDSVFQPVPRKLTPADSVYLSFWFQPQGRGRAPQTNDSLILQFLVKPGYDSLIPGGGTYPIPDLWRRVWFSNGMSLDTFFVKYNKWFVRVMIPVTDPIFFRNNFRFRFFNYASLASISQPSWQTNTDHWNLDQVYLNQGRSVHDTLIPELRFIQRPTGLLKRYTSMPYTQYSENPTNELRDSLDVLMTNHDVVSRMSTYGYDITQPGGAFTKSYSGGNYNIEPYTLSPYVTWPKFAHPDMPFLLPVGTADSALFMVRHIVREVAAGSAIGDTVFTFQRFYNYYSYDDGTPEASYGLTPAGSKLAVSFKLNKSPDTLRAVKIYFNQTLSDPGERSFYLCVWNDNAGKPGDTIYSQLVYPRHADSLNKFVTYHVYPPLAITGTFYVGWIQTTGDNLCVGYDQYNNSQQSVFFSTLGAWQKSSYTGSLMIRPVIGKPIPLGISSISSPSARMMLSPNPCTGSAVRIIFPSGSPISAEKSMPWLIRDMTGRVISEGFYTGVIDVSGLAGGLYLVELHDASGHRMGISKLLISR